MATKLTKQNHPARRKGKTAPAAVAVMDKRQNPIAIDPTVYSY